MCLCVSRAVADSKSNNSVSAKYFQNANKSFQKLRQNREEKQEDMTEERCYSEKGRNGKLEVDHCEATLGANYSFVYHFYQSI